MTTMIEQDRQIAAVVAEEGSRLRNFIRRRVPNDCRRRRPFAGSFRRTGGSHTFAQPIDYVTVLAVSRGAQSDHGFLPQEAAGDILRGRGR